MSDHRASTTILMPAEVVFDFVGRPENMPRYLDSVASVDNQGAGVVEVVGETAGRAFRTQGWFEIDTHHLMVRWGASGGHAYAGHMTVTPMDDSSCKIEVHLLVANGGQAGFAGRSEEDVWRSLDETVACIKSLCEQSLQPYRAYRNRYVA
jgi:hypothetical protein